MDRCDRSPIYLSSDRADFDIFPPEDQPCCRHCKHGHGLFDNKSTGKGAKHLNDVHNLWDPKKTAKGVREKTPIRVPDYIEWGNLIALLVAVQHLPFKVIESKEFGDII